MTKPTLISEKPAAMFLVKEELESIKKREKELNFRSQKTEEYLNQFTSLSRKEGEELTKKIAALEIPRLKDVHIIKIIDIMPQSVEDLKSVLSAYPVTISNENLKKIIDVLFKSMGKETKEKDSE